MITLLLLAAMVSNDQSPKEEAPQMVAVPVQQMVPVCKAGYELWRKHGVCPYTGMVASIYHIPQLQDERVDADEFKAKAPSEYVCRAKGYKAPTVSCDSGLTFNSGR